MKKGRLIYVYASRSSFVENDIDILGREYEVQEYRFNARNKSLIPLTYLSQFFFFLFNIFSCQGIIVMFGGHQSFIPALFGKVFSKPCMIICGGTDCVSFPSIGYGNFRGGMLSTVTKWSYTLAACIAPVHKSLVEYEYSYDNRDFKRQGILFFMSKLKTRIEVLNYGFDPDKWKGRGTKISNSFITVAAGLDKPYRAQLKGVDFILEAASHFPDSTFTIIGCPEGYKLPIQSNNVKVYSYVSNSELKEIYNTHEFYLQVSMSEGFPNAICEAMSCGCIPIGSNVGGIPDIIGDAGFVLSKRDVELFKGLLQEAVSCDKQSYSARAQQRIAQQYPKELREKGLLSLVSNLLSNE